MGLCAHLYAEAALDAELRAYLPVGPQVAPGAWQARGLPVGDVDVRALDVGDTDGDGRAEVVAATSGELVAWSLAADGGNHFVERWRARLDGKPAAIRPRADVVAVAVDGGAAVAHASVFESGVRRSGHGGGDTTLMSAAERTSKHSPVLFPSVSRPWRSTPVSCTRLPLPAIVRWVLSRLVGSSVSKKLSPCSRIQVGTPLAACW